MSKVQKQQKPIVWVGDLPESPLGQIWAANVGGKLVALDLWGDRDRFWSSLANTIDGQIVYGPERLKESLEQVANYLTGDRQNFDIKIDWAYMTPFQREVLRVVDQIPFGETRTYGDIAKALGKPGAMRAVGRANATNPLPIVIPCHRVLGAGGRLHGFSAPGGLETKAWLLRLEGSWLI